ncbi:unnamed protein product, partial [Ixodes hexagonus]
MISIQGTTGSAYKSIGSCPSSQTTSAVRKPETPPIVRRLRRNAWMTSCKFDCISSDDESDEEKLPEVCHNALNKTACKPTSTLGAPQRPLVRLPIKQLKQRSYSLARRGTSAPEKPEAKKPVHKLGPSRRQETLSAHGRTARPLKQQVAESNCDSSASYKENLMTLVKDSKPKEEKGPIIQVNGATYQTLKLIGKGGSSKASFYLVYRVVDERQELRALKLVSLEGVEPEATKAFLNEVRILKTLRDCSRVVTLYDFEYDQKRDLLMLVMEAGEDDLASVVRSAMEMGSLSLLTVKFYWSEMLHAVLEIHNKGVIHSDLKPANFLFVKGRLKLIDFGIADIIQADTTSVMKESQMGTVNFMPPESITRFPANGTGDCRLKISQRSDVWSLGCILYILAYGRAPFQHIVARDDRLRAIINPNFAIQFPPLADANLLDVLKTRGQTTAKMWRCPVLHSRTFLERAPWCTPHSMIGQCLRRNVRERPTISELLQHPFLNEDGALLKPQRNERLQSMFSEIENMSPESVKKVNEVM